MERIACDVAIIGAGTAGLTAERAASDAGAETCLVEAGPAGTTCARVGCMPSKLLIAAAEVAHAAQTGQQFGVQSGDVRIDGRRVMARVRKERDRFVAGVIAGMKKHPPSRYLEGRARFLSPNTLGIDDHTTVEAKAIVIATGARPSIPGPFQNLGTRLLTNETIFELEDLPESVAVIGTGPLGLELGQALHRLGVRTALFDQGGRLGGLSDESVNAAAIEAFGQELDMRMNVEAGAKPVENGVCISWKDKTGKSGEETFARVLVAAGRKPMLDGLDLERAEIPLDEHGTPLFDPATMRCADSAIFIAGDVDHDRPLLHEAALEGKIAGRNAACYPRVEKGDRSVPLSIVFTEPGIATVGAADPNNPNISRGSIDFSDQGRARVMGVNKGLLHVYGDLRTRRLAGAQMACPGAEHLAHLIAWAVEAGLSARAMIDLPYYHPTLEEGLRSAFRDLCSTMHVAPAMQTPTLEYGPGG